MFDIVVAYAPGASFAGRVASALRDARMRVVAWDTGLSRSPPTLRTTDVAVACASTAVELREVARALRAALDGPPPVLGVCSEITAAGTGELADLLGDDAPQSRIVAHVQRAAARAQRRRSRAGLRGDLAEVGLDGLLESLASRGRSAVVRVRAEGRSAEIDLDAGRVVHVRLDGVDATRDRRDSLVVIAGWTGAAFEVISADHGPHPVSSVRVPTSSPTPPGSARSQMSAADVALGAAVVNACAAYARAWMPPAAVTRLLTRTWTQTQERDAGLDAFVISPDGMVSVAHLERARASLPRALARWIAAFFDAAAQEQPERFRSVRIRDVLGGLGRLVEQVGWESALFEGQRP